MIVLQTISANATPTLCSMALVVTLQVPMDNAPPLANAMIRCKDGLGLASMGAVFPVTRYFLVLTIVCS